MSGPAEMNTTATAFATAINTTIKTDDSTDDGIISLQEPLLPPEVLGVQRGKWKYKTNLQDHRFMLSYGNVSFG